MGYNLDLEMPVDGVRARPGDIDLSEGGLTLLFMAAAEFTDDLADQVEVVALCVIGRIDHNELRRRAGLGGIVPDRPTPPRATIIHHQRSASRK